MFSDAALSSVLPKAQNFEGHNDPQGLIFEGHFDPEVPIFEGHFKNVNFYSLLTLEKVTKHI